MMKGYARLFEREKGECLGVWRSKAGGEDEDEDWSCE
jgi:hypothetical protein